MQSTNLKTKVNVIRRDFSFLFIYQYQYELSAKEKNKQKNSSIFITILSGRTLKKEIEWF